MTGAGRDQRRNLRLELKVNDLNCLKVEPRPLLRYSRLDRIFLL